MRYVVRYPRGHRIAGKPRVNPIRHAAAPQVVASATHTAQGLDDTAHTKATASRGAAAALEEAGDETQRLAVRCSALLAALAHERDSKKVRPRKGAIS